jgi:hypothetical protein
VGLIGRQSKPRIGFELPRTIRRASFGYFVVSQKNATRHPPTPKY